MGEGVRGRRGLLRDGGGDKREEGAFEGWGRGGEREEEVLSCHGSISVESVIDLFQSLIEQDSVFLAS